MECLRHIRKADTAAASLMNTFRRHRPGKKKLTQRVFKREGKKIVLYHSEKPAARFFFTIFFFFSRIDAEKNRKKKKYS